MPEDTLDHQRAAFAARRVLQERFPPAERSPAPIKDYRGVALGAVPQLRGCGLLQLAAFWLTKKARTGDAAERMVLEDLVLWLRTAPTTRSLCNSRPPDLPELKTAPSPELLLALTKRSSQEVAVLEREAEAFLGWLKRVAEGLHKEVSRTHEEAGPADE